MKTFSSLLLVIVFLQSFSAHALTYAAYRPWALGGARPMSLGGAFAAVGDDAASVWMIPAMLSLRNPGIDLSYTSGQVVASEFPLPETTTGSGDFVYRQQYTQFSISQVFGHDWGFAFGNGTPLTDGFDRTLQNVDYMQLKETRFAVTKAVLKDFSLGVVAIRRALIEHAIGFFDSSSIIQPQELEKVDWGVGFSAGIDLGEHWLMAASYETSSTFDLTNPVGLTVIGNNIQPAKIPPLMRLGVSRSWPEWRLLASLEGDAWFETRGLSSYLDAPYDGPRSLSEKDTVVVPRFGLEFMILERNWFKAWTRGGWYGEPPRVLQNKYKDHWTIGLESRIWILLFNFAYDRAQDFTNAATSIGVALTSYL